MPGEAMVARRDAAAPDASARLAAMGKAYVTFALTHAGHFRVMFRGDAKAALAQGPSASSQRTFDLLIQVIQDCLRAGTAPPGDPGPLVLTAWSVVHGMATLWLDVSLPKTPLDPASLVPVVTNLIAQMFAALAKGGQFASPQSLRPARRWQSLFSRPAFHPRLLIVGDVSSVRGQGDDTRRHASLRHHVIDDKGAVGVLVHLCRP
jgi:hypothetical protein